MRLKYLWSKYYQAYINITFIIIDVIVKNHNILIIICAHESLE